MRGDSRPRRAREPMGCGKSQGQTPARQAPAAVDFGPSPADQQLEGKRLTEAQSGEPAATLDDRSNGDDASQDTHTYSEAMEAEAASVRAVVQHAEEMVSRRFQLLEQRLRALEERLGNEIGTGAEALRDLQDDNAELASQFEALSAKVDALDDADGRGAMKAATRTTTLSGMSGHSLQSSLEEIGIGGSSPRMTARQSARGQALAQLGSYRAATQPRLEAIASRPSSADSHPAVAKQGAHHKNADRRARGPEHGGDSTALTQNAAPDAREHGASSSAPAKGPADGPLLQGPSGTENPGSETPKPRVKEWTVTVDRSRSEELGIVMNANRKVEEVKAEGLIPGWNARNPKREVRPGDFVRDVNGQRNVKRIVAELRLQKPLVLVLERSLETPLAQALPIGHNESVDENGDCSVS